ncbi:uncharacterized protein LOC101855827 [Aplysia californica]|uniref:Uncharacterized protein LOC101855827 n=1 Tax=Aplysia californica TaxID=6500 RepID=A0ABM0K5U6_APLCA|nr:uncharacterized protein LOC101855827 [Aplysia californica]
MCKMDRKRCCQFLSHWYDVKVEGVRLRDWCRPLPEGRVKCSNCKIVIKYSSTGLKALKRHAHSMKHQENRAAQLAVKKKKAKAVAKAKSTSAVKNLPVVKPKSLVKQRPLTSSKSLSVGKSRPVVKPKSVTNKSVPGVKARPVSSKLVPRVSGPKFLSKPLQARSNNSSSSRKLLPVPLFTKVSSGSSVDRRSVLAAGGGERKEAAGIAVRTGGLVLGPGRKRSGEGRDVLSQLDRPLTIDVFVAGKKTEQTKGSPAEAQFIFGVKRGFVDVYICFYCGEEFSSRPVLREHQWMCDMKPPELQAVTPPGWAAQPASILSSGEPSPASPLPPLLCALEQDPASPYLTPQKDSNSCPYQQPSTFVRPPKESFVSALGLLPKKKAAQVCRKRRNTECESINLEEDVPVSPLVPRTPKLLISHLSREGREVNNSSEQPPSQSPSLFRRRLSLFSQSSRTEKDGQKEKEEEGSSEGSSSDDDDGGGGGGGGGRGKVGRPGRRNMTVCKSLYNLPVTSLLGQFVIKHFKGDPSLHVLSDIESHCLTSTPKKSPTAGRLRERRAMYPTTFRGYSGKAYPQHFHQYKFNSVQTKDFLRRVNTGLDKPSRKLKRSMPACCVRLVRISPRDLKRWIPSQNQLTVHLKPLTDPEIAFWTSPKRASAAESASVFPSGLSFSSPNVQKILGLRTKQEAAASRWRWPLSLSHVVSEEACAEMVQNRRRLFQSLICDSASGESGSSEEENSPSRAHSVLRRLLSTASPYLPFRQPCGALPDITNLKVDEGKDRLLQLSRTQVSGSLSEDCGDGEKKKVAAFGPCVSERQQGGRTVQLCERGGLAVPCVTVRSSTPQPPAHLPHQQIASSQTKPCLTTVPRLCGGHTVPLRNSTSEGEIIQPWTEQYATHRSSSLPASARHDKSSVDDAITDKSKLSSSSSSSIRPTRSKPDVHQDRQVIDRACDQTIVVATVPASKRPVHKELSLTLPPAPPKCPSLEQTSARSVWETQRNVAAGCCSAVCGTSSTATAEGKLLPGGAKIATKEGKSPPADKATIERAARALRLAMRNVASHALRHRVKVKETVSERQDDTSSCPEKVDDRSLTSCSENGGGGDDEVDGMSSTFPTCGGLAGGTTGNVMGGGEEGKDAGRVSCDGGGSVRERDMRTLRSLLSSSSSSISARATNSGSNATLSTKSRADAIPSVVKTNGTPEVDRGNSTLPVNPSAPSFLSSSQDQWCRRAGTPTKRLPERSSPRNTPTPNPPTPTPTPPPDADAATTDVASAAPQKSSSKHCVLSLTGNSLSPGKFGSLVRISSSSSSLSSPAKMSSVKSGRDSPLSSWRYERGLRELNPSTRGSRTPPQQQIQQQQQLRRASSVGKSMSVLQRAEFRKSLGTSFLLDAGQRKGQKVQVNWQL